MTAGRFVTVATEVPGVRVLSIDRPPVNALGGELVSELATAVADLAEDAGVRCLVIRSGGRHFCAGADLKEREGMTTDEVRAFVPRLGALATSIASLPFPTIAAVRGTAAGGGCELALACDLRVLSEDAVIGLRETALAIIPGAGGTQRLPRIAGIACAKKWIFSAKLFDAATALADGVAEAIVPDGRLDEESVSLAKTIAANGPVAVRLAKKAIEAGWDLSLDEALALEWQCYQGVLSTEDRVEALRAFAQKRPPMFEGR